MKILVTGGAGFIGSHFVDHCVHLGYVITVLDKLTYAAALHNINPAASVIIGDICDPHIVRDAMSGHDAVVNFAAETHVDRSIQNPGLFVQTNLMGTQTLLDAALETGVSRFVQVSTDEVYGPCPVGSYDEESPLRPTSPYAASKAGADLLALSMHRTHGLDVVITRGCNTYGKRQYMDKLVPLSVYCTGTGVQFPLHGTGMSVREWIHVEDHARGVHHALICGNRGEIYNIGSGHRCTNLQVISDIHRLMCGHDRPDLIKTVPDRPGQDVRYALRCEKSHHVLKFFPRISWREGISNTVQWYTNNLNWWTRTL
jgi:dTDP-glucose 4,6-dehydratase